MPARGDGREQGAVPQTEAESAWDKRRKEFSFSYRLFWRLRRRTDWVIYSRQLGSEISRNEVIVFDKYGENFVKRVTGLPGDTVEISKSGGRVIVNHEEVQANYVILTKPGEGEMESRMSQPMTVMEDQYLVLGDNRGVSIDSRDSKIGTVPREDILGKVILIIRTSG